MKREREKDGVGREEDGEVVEEGAEVDSHSLEEDEEEHMVDAAVLSTDILQAWNIVQASSWTGCDQKW